MRGEAKKKIVYIGYDKLMRKAREKELDRRLDALKIALDEYLAFRNKKEENDL